MGLNDVYKVVKGNILMSRFLPIVNEAYYKVVKGNILMSRPLPTVREAYYIHASSRRTSKGYVF